MGGYFADKLNALLGVPTAIGENLILLIAIFGLLVPAALYKWRSSGNSTRAAIDSVTHGLRTSADTRLVRHDTGVGTKQVRVMRPAKLGGTVWFGLIFFGGGAVFFGLVVLQSPDVTAENWWTFAGLTAFTITAMILIEANQTRIYADDTTLEKRRVLHRRHIIKRADITRIVPLGNDITRGARLITCDGGSMRVQASFSGYQDLIFQLKGVPHA